MKFGEKLKELRTENGVTQKQLANAINFAQSRISDWEKEVTEPSANAIIAIALLFNVATDYLLGLEDESGAKINTKYHIGTFNNNGGTVDIK